MACLGGCCVGKKRREKLHGGPGRHIRRPEHPGMSKKKEADKQPRRAKSRKRRWMRAGTRDKGTLPQERAGGLEGWRAGGLESLHLQCRPFPGGASQGASRHAGSESHGGEWDPSRGRWTVAWVPTAQALLARQRPLHAEPHGRPTCRATSKAGQQPTGSA